MPRFVILEHDHPELHWDLMLEDGATLRTWRLARPPEPGVMVSAMRIGDHRLAYLDYEGPVSGGRGTVQRWDTGDFAWLVDELGSVAVRCLGQRLKGILKLNQAAGATWSSLWQP
jgi:hypothetical protein